MIRFSFRKGLCFLEMCGAKLQRLTLIKRLPSGKLQLEDPDGETSALEPGVIMQRWQEGRCVIDEESLSSASNVFSLATPRDLSTFTEKQQNVAKYRYSYISHLEKTEGWPNSTPDKLSPHIQAISDEIKDKSPPSPSSIWRWWLKYAVTRSITKLVDGRFRAGRKRDEEGYSLFEEALSEVYMNPQKDQGKAVVDAVKLKVKRANANAEADRQIKCPSRASIYRWLAGLHADLVARARLGDEAGDREFRVAMKRFKVSRILERIEIDHTPLDLIVIDKLTKLPLGRPWLTLAVDRYSRMIMGFYISFHAPSSFTLLQCLKRAIMPKDEWLARFPDIKGIWPAYGFPELIASDNGMDLHADAYELACLEMGIEALFCPAKLPYLKGAIERLFRTFNTGLIHGLPGTVFSNIDERGDYPAEDLAAIDMETLTHVLTKWVVEVYHLRRHRGLNMPPLAAWQESAGNVVIELPAYPRQLELLVGIPATRTLFHYGLEIDYLRYNSDALRMIRARDGGTPKMTLRYYEDDVGHIDVYDPVAKEYIRVDAVDAEYAKGLNKHMHLLIRQYTAKKHGDRWSDEQLLESKAEIQAIVAAAIQDKKMANRKQAAILTANDSEQVLAGKAAFAEAIASETCRPAEPEPLLDPGLDDDIPDFGTRLRTGTEG